MSALLRVYNDILNRRLVVSASNPDTFAFPTISQEDGLDFEYFALRPNGSFLPPIYDPLVLSGYSLYIGVGIAGTVYSGQNTFTPNSNNTSLSGLVDLNTSGMNGLADGATVTLEFRLTSPTGGSVKTVVQVTFRKAVILSTAVVTPATEQALGRTEAKRIYLPKELGAGEGIVFTSSGGTKRVMYLHDDGTPRFEPFA